jgi:uncharacterized protein YkwD
MGKAVLNSQSVVSRRYLKINRWVKYLITFLLFVTVYFVPQLTIAAEAPSLYSGENGSQVISRTEAENYYLNSVNNLRVTKKLGSLIIDRRLSLSAENKNIDMINNNYWGHFAYDGTNYYQFIWNKSPKSKKVGENLAKCYTDREKAFKSLVASPTHYDIMTGNFSNIGISETYNAKDNCIYTTMHFSLTDS